MAAPQRAIPQRAAPSRALPQQSTTTNGSGRTVGDIVANRISPLTANGMSPTLLAPREKILLVGDTVSGKSFAFYNEAFMQFKESLAENREPPHYWVVDTDDSAPKFLWPGYEFAEASFTVGGNISPFPTFNLNDVRSAVKTILDNASALRGDWVVVDVVNRIYEYAQRARSLSNNKDLDDEWLNRQNAGAGFGAFEAGDWNVVRRMFEAGVYRLFDNYRGNVLLLQHLKEIVAHFDKPADPRTKRREMMTLFGPLGYKPDGAPNLIKAMDTIIVCWVGREADVSGRMKAVRKFVVLKDRGEIEQSPEMYFGRQLFQDFYNWRRTGSPVQTVESKEEADEIEARINANSQATREANAESTLDTEQPAIANTGGESIE